VRDFLEDRSSLISPEGFENVCTYIIDMDHTAVEKVIIHWWYDRSLLAAGPVRA
jgi:hypothetical protein